MTVLLTKDGDTAYVCFNRPNAMNTFNDKMSIDLLATLQDIRDDASIMFVVLKGAENKFMAGGDVSFFAKNLETMPKGVDVIIDRLNESILLLTSMPKMTIAAIEGACAGVGISFCLACDLAICDDNVKFNTGYTALGLSPDGGMTYMLSQHVGRKKALEWILTSECFMAKEALASGLVNQLCCREDLSTVVDGLIQSLRAKSYQALLSCKKLLNNNDIHLLNTQLKEEKESFIRLSQTQDFKSAVRRFIAAKK